MRLARESFTIPMGEQEKLNGLAEQLSGIKPRLKKSEIIRLGIISISQKKESEIVEMVQKDFARLMAGRPRKKEEISEGTEEISAELVLSDRQWRNISKLLLKIPSKQRKARPLKNAREVINGILYIFRHKTQRRFLPKEYNISFHTCRRRLIHWIDDSLWKEICSNLISSAENEEEKKVLEGILLRTFLLDTRNNTT